MWIDHLALCRLTQAGARDLAKDGGPIFSTIAKLVDALS